MLQNDLVHGWGLDFALRKCVEVKIQIQLIHKACIIYFHKTFWKLTTSIDIKQPAHEKIGVVDSQWIIHQKITSLADQVILND